MKQLVLFATATLIMCQLGVGLESPHPAWFAFEPIVIATEEPQTPSLTPFFVDHTWVKLESTQGQTTWALLVHHVSGITTITVQADGEEKTLVVVPQKYGILEVPNYRKLELSVVPPVAEVLRIQYSRHIALVCNPGSLALQFKTVNTETDIPLSIERAERKVLEGLVKVELKPGSTISLLGARSIIAYFSIQTELALDELHILVTPPTDWEITPEILFLEGAETAAERMGWALTNVESNAKLQVRFIADIPKELPPGEYALGISIPELGISESATIQVKSCLPPVEAVLRWDPATSRTRLDIPLPKAPTGDQLAWAVVWTVTGQPPPYACAPLTKEELELLGEYFERD